MMTINRRLLLLILFTLLIFVIRFMNINEALYDDEANFAYSLTVMDALGFNHDFPSPQPFNLLFKPLIFLFGLEVWVFRLIPLFFGVVNTFLVYLFTARNFGRREAFFATILMLIGFYPTLASLQLDVEGNFVLFSFLLLMFSYVEAEKAENNKKKNIWRIVGGLSLGLAVILKYNAVYIVGAITLHSLILKRGDIKAVFEDLFLLYGVGFVLFITHLGLAFVASSGDWLNYTPLFSWYNGFENAYQAKEIALYGVSLLGIIMFALWATPLLLGFYFLSFFHLIQRRNKRELLLILWITVAILFYTFFMTSGSLDRYFMNTIPAMAILGGIFLSSLSFSRTEKWYGVTLTFFSLFFFFLLNSIPFKYIPRLPNIYFQELQKGNSHFLFSYTSASGPTFGINFTILLLVFLIAYSSLFLYIILNWWSSWKRRAIKSEGTYLFVTFLAVSIAFNLFLVTEYVVHPTGVDVSTVKEEMINYVFNEKLAYPIYTTDSGMMWYFNHQHWAESKKPDGNVLGIPDYETEEGDDVSEVTLRSIQRRGGTILLVNWPPIPEESHAWQIVKHCRLEREFFSKGQLVGAIYACDVQNNSI